MRVRDLMSRPVFTCSVHDLSHVAAQIMWEHDCGIVPVVDDDRRLVGVITDRDLSMAACFQGLPLQEIPIEAVMTRDLCTCRPDDAVIAAEQRMREWQVHRLPVVDAHDVPVGILSLADVARHLDETGGRSRQDLAATVAAISEKRTPRA